jgi:hypothetical protein
MPRRLALVRHNAEVDPESVVTFEDCATILTFLSDTHRALRSSSNADFTVESFELEISGFDGYSNSDLLLVAIFNLYEEFLMRNNALFHARRSERDLYL